MITKFLISAFMAYSLFFSPLNNFLSYKKDIQASKNFLNVYIYDIFVINNSRLEFYLPLQYDVKTLIPISFTSPSGKQLLKILPSFIEPLEHRIVIPLYYPLTEKGTYTITFTAIDQRTDLPINIHGSFSI